MELNASASLNSDILIIVGILTVSAFGALIAALAIRSKRFSFVKSHSNALSQLEIENEKLESKLDRTLNRQCKIPPRCLKSKRQFDQFDPRKTICKIIYDDFDKYTGLIHTARENETNYRDYRQKLTAILENDTAPEDLPRFFFSSSQYQSIEKELFDKETHQPAPLTMTLKWQYTSPKGRNSYQDSMRFNLKELSELLEKVKKQSDYKQSAAYQRALMTKSLRYKILKRDGYRCQLCGRRAVDGHDVLLEVDHKIPVSQGGQTVEENLWTLCWDCNRGKRAKPL